MREDQLAIMGLSGTSSTILATASERVPMAPNAHHGGYHMTEWPWWPGPMHLAYPILFVVGVVAVVVLLWRKS